MMQNKQLVIDGILLVIRYLNTRNIKLSELAALEAKAKAEGRALDVHDIEGLERKAQSAIDNILIKEGDAL